MATHKHLCYTVRYTDSAAIGARVEACGPTDCTYRCVAQLTYPKSRVRIKVTRAGAWSFRHVLLYRNGNSAPSVPVCVVVELFDCDHDHDHDHPPNLNAIRNAVKDTLDRMWK